MGKYDSLFKKMAATEDVGNDFAERVKLGEHVLRLTHYGIKESDQEMGAIIEAEFEVVESTTYDSGAVCGCAWWPQMPGKFAAGYQTTRNKAFVRAVAQSEALGDQDMPFDEIGGKMVEDDQPYRGILVHCMVTQGKPKKDEPGEHYQNEKWTAIPQSEEELVAAREELDGRSPMKIVKPAAPPTKPATKPATAPAAGKTKSLLSGYGKK